MRNIAIEVKGLGKEYRIGGRRDEYRTFRDMLTNTIVSPFRRARKLLQGQVSGVSDLDERIWALRDISFDVKHGEVIGIIGHNGAGKSTLLKIFSRITEPTEGYAIIKGRVGSLLEVGTGFHMELTGRENIYLNGAILGMKRSEIERKFDEIMGFAEVDKFIDTPVKYYSSGMRLRLGFAVAAYLEPDILVVDEVLAVGDFEFQKKCLGKMNDVAKDGRTVLFVSHQMGAIGSLCDKVILLDKGRIKKIGDAFDVISDYEGSLSGANEFKEKDRHDLAYIRSGCIVGPSRLQYGNILHIELEVFSSQELQSAIYWRMRDAFGIPVATGVPQVQLGKFQKLEKGINIVHISIGPLPLFVGEYRLSFDLNHSGTRYIQRLEGRLAFSIYKCDPSNNGGYLLSKWRSGSIVIPFNLKLTSRR